MPLTVTIDPAALLELGRYLQAQGYRFVTPTPATHARVNARLENTWASDVRGLLGWSRPLPPDLDAAGPAVPGELLEAMRAAGVLVPCREGWRSSVRASTLGGQLYFHSAYPTVEDDAVFFGPDTYRFVRAVLAVRAPARPRRIIEIGCGAAPAATVLALRHPEAEVIAADVNPRALLLAEVNARLAGAANLRTCRSDVLDGVDGRFDLVVSNPPYMVDDSARAYRHGGGELGGELSQRIVEQGASRLATGGQLLLYTGSAIVDGHDRLGERAGAWLARAGLAWTYDEIDPDVFGEELERPAYARAERIAAVLLTAQQR